MENFLKSGRSYMGNLKLGKIWTILFILVLLIPSISHLWSSLKESDKFEDEMFSFSPPKFQERAVAEWKVAVRNVDIDENGLNDQFEHKLTLLSEYYSLRDSVSINSSLAEKFMGLNNFIIRNNNEAIELYSEIIPIIAYFPQGEIDSIFVLFMSLGGKIKTIYQNAINGFAGSIKISEFYQFTSILKSEEVPFLIEEDSRLEINLYYTSRNMNLRPYVWNTLGYRGDEYGSIAVLDSGIDESHVFFEPGYVNGDFNYKIVGWKDELNNLSSPYDDNGHGTHVAGILSGNSSSILDANGRIVATYAYEYDKSASFISNRNISKIVARFNVTEPGLVEISCAFEDLTSGIGDVFLWAYLYHNESIMDSYQTNLNTWNHTLSYNATNSSLGDYSLRIFQRIYSSTGLVGGPHMKFRAGIHWPFNPPLLGNANTWSGIAPNTHLVGVKVVDSYGQSTLSDVLAGINWVLMNKELYNITVISISLGGDAGQISLISAVNNAVENGIVVVTSAGNEGGLGNNIGSPGDADNVITVAAMSIADQVTNYSSSGGLSYTGNTIKPDIMAPGGSYFNFSIFSSDSNDNDGAGAYSIDLALNDLLPSLGTSMAAPAVAGAANLLIEAMGGYPNWNYSAIEAKRVKALLLMAATETYPLIREQNSNNSPQLDRGGKDHHEGYGRLNIDAALEAYIHELSLNSTKTAWLSSSEINPYNKHALGCYVLLLNGQDYLFQLDTPMGCDYDLYLYSDIPSNIGEPILISSSTSGELGRDEIIRYKADETGKYYLIAKAVTGEGYAKVSNIPNYYSPYLLNGSVSPPTGDQSVLFNFSVRYFDQDNYKPVSVILNINGTQFSMEKQDENDTDYSDGCEYYHQNYLQPGFYSYYFEGFDGKFTNFTDLYTIFINESNNFAPLLLNPRVLPTIGGNTTIFNFTVWYSDADNNFPKQIDIIINNVSYPMIPVNSLDDNAIDGKEYYYNSLLAFGNYQCMINCSDGAYKNSTAWLNQPEVNPFYVMSRKSIIINEIFGGTPDFIELYNYGANLNMTNWTLQIYSDNVLYDTYCFPMQWTFCNSSTVVVNEGIGNNSAFTLYTGWNIPWEGGGIAVGLFDNYNNPVDWMQTSAFVGNKPQGMLWEQDIPLNIINNYAYRNDDNDTNKASDWIIAALGSKAALNPGQSGKRDYVMNTKLLEPYNNQSYFSGLFNFQWNSLEFPICQVNYTLQISNSSNFSSILLEIRNIIEIINITSISLSIDYPSNQYFWRVIPTFGPFYGDMSIPNSFYVILNAFPPELINGTVIPSMGSQHTEFNFSIIYKDLDNNPPLSMNISINGIDYSLEQYNLSENSYNDGCIFQFQTVLDPGYYNYSFYCFDGKFLNSFMPPDELNVTEANLYMPILTDGQVNTQEGYDNTTLFIFRVNYTDLDNNKPIYVNVTINATTYSMVQLNQNDTNYKDGSIFVHSTYLKTGTYQYYFNCSDGLNKQFNGPFSGLNVDDLIEWNLIPLNGIRVGGVIAHGERNPRTRYAPFPYVSLELLQRGVNFTDITSFITLEVLSNYDMIWIDEMGIAMNSSEVAAIIEWIENGGRVLITGGELWAADPLIQQLNLSYYSNTINGYTKSIYFHPTTAQVEQLYFSDHRIALNISKQSKASICAEIAGHVMAIAMELGDGRISFVGDITILTNSLVADNHFFINNTFGWLCYRNKYHPELSNGTVNPLFGDQLTQFNFTVLYRDLDNNSPSFVSVRINGTSFTMQKQNSSDFDYTDGCIYRYSSKLKPGSYNYSFECRDWIFYNVTGIPNWLIIQNTNNIEPKLVDPQVSPVIGGYLTEFNFTVYYFDEDNNFPSYVNITINNRSYEMFQVNLSDENYIDGALFCHTDFLNFGYYQFRVFCSDGSFYNMSGWIQAPEVNPFHGISQTISLIKPNISVYSSSWIYFNWTSLELPFGSVNYTLQISNSSDFSTILIEILDIQENPLKSYTSIKMDLPEGYYYWRICPTYGVFQGNWTDNGVIIVTKAPILPNYDAIVIIILLLIMGIILTVTSFIIKIRNFPKRSTVESPKMRIDKSSSIEQKSLFKSNLRLLSKEFSCQNCKKSFLIDEQDIFSQYKCEKCNQPLKRILECERCGFILPFNQEDFLRIIGQEIKCPRCTKSNYEDNHEKISDSRGKMQEEEIKEIMMQHQAIYIEDSSKFIRIMQDLIAKIDIPKLIGILLYEPEGKIRAMAALALAGLGNETVLPILAKLHKDIEDPPVNKGISDAIRWIKIFNRI